MKNDRKYRMISILILMLVVVGLSVAFAVLSQTLNITGTTTVRGSTWKIEFENLGVPPTKTGNVVEDEEPSLTATTMSFELSMYTPGDSIIYTFDVANKGTIDAEIDSITVNSEVVDAGGITPVIEDDIITTLTYDDGSLIKVGDKLPATTNNIKSLKLKVEYDSNVTEVPNSDQTPVTYNVTIVYVQQQG